MVLWCDDCICYYLGKCYEQGVIKVEVFEVFVIVNFVGGFICILYMCWVVEYWEVLEEVQEFLEDGFKKWKINMSYLDELNDVQWQVVMNIDGFVLVVVGLGFGKIWVLIYCIVYLIEKGIVFWEIFVLIFINKVVCEMKEWIGKVVGLRVNCVWVGIFYFIFVCIFWVEVEKIGYLFNFIIYDLDDFKSVIWLIIQEMNLNKDYYNFNVILLCIFFVKSSFIILKFYEKDEELWEQDCMAKCLYFYVIYKKYMVCCKCFGVMDFDDLLYCLYEFFQKNLDNVFDKYWEKFKYVLVDEFQDINYLQYFIIWKFIQYDKSDCNICVVGDDVQSIYVFWGVIIQNILDFEKDFEKYGIKVFKLE